MDEIEKITPEQERACRALLEGEEGSRNRGPFTPASEEGALIFPTRMGGAQWSGSSFDPTLGH